MTDKNRGKEILLTNRRIARNDAPLPESLTTFLEKLAKIDEDLEVKYELRQ